MSRNWYAATAPLRQEFRTLLDPARLRALHRASGWRHGAVALRQFVLAGAAAWWIVRFRDGWLWLPAAVLLGFLVFGFTVLLHEVVHRAVFRRRLGRANRLLAWLYAAPSGLSPSQFERWHLDHHAELGTEDLDPKRRYLTPRVGRRWFKALYFTPALFPIYFLAAARAAKHYPATLRARLRRERAVVVAVHVAIIAAIALAWGWGVLVKLYVIPVFFVFPIAFSINRLGQHYDITPEDPAAWGTIIRSNFVWDFLFLWSSYHMEHHYFPGVPFYNLPALHRALAPLLERHPVRTRTYSGLLYDWLIRNQTPHTRWTVHPEGGRNRL